MEAPAKAFQLTFVSKVGAFPFSYFTPVRANWLLRKLLPVRLQLILANGPWQRQQLYNIDFKRQCYLSTFLHPMAQKCLLLGLLFSLVWCQSGAPFNQYRYPLWQCYSFTRKFQTRMMIRIVMCWHSSLFCPNITDEEKMFLTLTSGTVFTTLHFLQKLLMGPIS